MLETPTLAAQLAAAARRFTEHFGQPPRFAAAAPGRVNLIGEHTDYNDGFVLPMAIQRQTLIVAAPTPAPGTPGKPGTPGREPRQVRLLSTGAAEPAQFTLNKDLQPGEPKWANYCKGVLTGCLAQGLDPDGFDALIDSNVPSGGGLSSSAALEVATATLVEAMTARTLAPADKALLCQAAEHTFAGTPCGIMDQFISVLGQEGQAMLLDCRSRRWRMVPLDDPAVTVLIVNSNVKHELASGEYAQRRAQCAAAAKAMGLPSLREATMARLEAARGAMDSVSFRRARHVITENQRTQLAADAMSGNRWSELGELMYQSHASLRNDFEVSCPELDLLVDLAQALGPAGGVLGARMTGGGFGGCTVNLVQSAAVQTISRQLQERYLRQTGIEPMIFATGAGAGARVLEV